MHAVPCALAHLKCSIAGPGTLSLLASRWHSECCTVWIPDSFPESPLLFNIIVISSFYRGHPCVRAAVRQEEEAKKSESAKAEAAGPTAQNANVAAANAGTQAIGSAGAAGASEEDDSQASRGWAPLRPRFPSERRCGRPGCSRPTARDRCVSMGRGEGLCPSTQQGQSADAAPRAM